MGSATLDWLKQTRGVFARPQWDVAFFAVVAVASTVFALAVVWNTDRFWQNVLALDIEGLVAAAFLFTAFALDVVMLTRFALVYEFDGTHIRRFGLLSRPQWTISVAEIHAARVRWIPRAGPFIEVTMTRGKRWIEAFPSMFDAGLPGAHLA
jgi:hypothetical protein